MEVHAVAAAKGRIVVDRQWCVIGAELGHALFTECGRDPGIGFSFSHSSHLFGIAGQALGGHNRQNQHHDRRSDDSDQDVELLLALLLKGAQFLTLAGFCSHVGLLQTGKSHQGDTSKVPAPVLTSTRVGGMLAPRLDYVQQIWQVFNDRIRGDF